MYQYIEALELCPAFQGVGGEEILRFIHCMGGGVAELDSNCGFERFSGKNLLYVVLSDIMTVTFPGMGEKVFSKGDILATSMIPPGAGVSITQGETVRLMCIDVGRALVTCGESCTHHVRIVKNLYHMLVSRNFTE